MSRFGIFNGASHSRILQTDSNGKNTLLIFADDLPKLAIKMLDKIYAQIALISMLLQTGLQGNSTKIELVLQPISVLV